MHSPCDAFIGYCIAAYFLLSLASAPFMLGYAVYRIIKKIKVKLLIHEGHIVEKCRKEI